MRFLDKKGLRNILEKLIPIFTTLFERLKMVIETKMYKK